MSNTCTCQRPQFLIPRSAFPYNEKAAYTDFVLDIWMQGRFGSGCEYQPFVQMSDRAEIDLAAFHNKLETRLKYFHALASLRRSPRQAIPHVHGTQYRFGMQDILALSPKVTQIIAWGEAAAAKPQVRVNNAHAP